MAQSAELAALDKIIHSEEIANVLRSNYPKVHALLEKHLEKTTIALCVQGAFQLLTMAKELDYAQTGNDNIKTWQEYKQGIIEYFKTINSDWRLKKAREVLADHIHDKHYTVFPCWPVVGGHQESTVFIDFAASYPESGFYIGWSCIGHVTVRDERRAAKAYHTKFSGKPVLKVLYCNKEKLEQFEALCARNSEEAEKAIGATTKPLLWGDLALN